MKEIKLNLSGHFNSGLESLGFTFPGTIQVDLAQDQIELVRKLTTLLKEFGVTTDSVVTIALPGLSGLAMLVVLSCHGLTGQFPLIQPLVKQADNSFAPTVEVWNSENLRNNISRTMRDNVIVL
jgi:small ligand-binding sensory domain FIST